MALDQENKKVNVDEKKKMSPREQRIQISQRYGLNKQSESNKGKARSINEVYNYRYKKKFR